MMKLDLYLSYDQLKQLQKLEMDNIFTFDIEEENVQAQKTEEICQKQLKIQKSNMSKQAITSPFVFEDFQQFSQQKSIEQKYQKRRLKIPGKENKSRFVNKDKNKNSSEFEEKKTEPEQPDVESTKNQIKTQILPGLEFQDLGANQMQYVSDKKALKVTDIRKFLHSPLGDYKVKAIIKKQGGNFFNFNSKFHVSIEQNNRYLFSITRQGLREYIFSLDKTNVSEKKKSYLGKMCSNLQGTQFLVFDSGFSPKQTRSLQSCRKQLASIKYQSIKGPRKFTTIVSTNTQGFYSLQPQRNILQQKWQKKQRDFLSIMYSKAPQFDPEDGNYKLDFKGIVKKASVKNFILGGVQWEDSLIFGKIDNQTFIMQIKEPLSVFQAAAICISSIHYKLQWR